MVTRKYFMISCFSAQESSVLVLPVLVGYFMENFAKNSAYSPRQFAAKLKTPIFVRLKAPHPH